MSWWVHLNCPCCKQPLSVENHSEGGTYAVGGTKSADLNITYNYSPHFYAALNIPGELRFDEYLTGKTGAEMMPELEKAVAQLGTKTSGDYWEDAPGNAGHALAILLIWAKQHPEGIFEVH